jgi:hypothetical protein
MFYNVCIEPEDGLMKAETCNLVSFWDYILSPSYNKLCLTVLFIVIILRYVIAAPRNDVEE